MVTRKNKIKSLTPLIFDNAYLSRYIYSLKPDYDLLCKNLYKKSAKYIKNNEKKISKITGLKMLYMNFKSHNIFDETSRQKLFTMFAKTNPDIICLSEALVPTFIADNMGKLLHLSNIKEDIITQPYRAQKPFENKKQADYHEIGGEKTMENSWVSRFMDLGFNFIIFGNPTQCPYGANWGNCILTKDNPDDAKIHQMDNKLCTKNGPLFGNKNNALVSESRCLVMVKINNHYIFSTHLDNDNADIRQAQTDNLLKYMDSFSGSKTLVGDMNSINKRTYTPKELAILTAFNYPPGKLPFETVDNISIHWNKYPLNTSQKYESKFQKCVSHVWSDVFNKYICLLTDATQFDHQPILIY